MYDLDFDLAANLYPALIDGVVKRVFPREYAIALATECMLKGIFSEEQLKDVMVRTKPGAEQPKG